QRPKKLAKKIKIKNKLKIGWDDLTVFFIKDLTGLNTQNIDGLHEESGLPADITVNLHGTNMETTCLDCGFTVPSDKIFDSLNLEQ
ncbi:MAG: Sir2 family NAD-dependent protein deacetylase, partial [Planctomycetota bacterium]